MFILISTDPSFFVACMLSDMVNWVLFDIMYDTDSISRFVADKVEYIPATNETTSIDDQPYYIVSILMLS